MRPDLVLLSRVSFRDRELAGPRLRGLIALLAGDLRTGCGAGRLIEALWPAEQPAHPAKALQILVSRARSQLGAEVIARTPGGYRLTLAEEQVDSSALLLRAAAAARCALSGDHTAALAHAEAGLGLWDGAGDEAGGPVAALRAERLVTHHSLVRSEALALARLDRAAEALPGLAGLTAERPRDEEVLVELLRCEAATAGPATALARYDAYRRKLRDDLGADPGAALQEEHRRLLRGAAPTVRQGVAHEPNPLLGRDDDVAAVEALLRTARVTSIVGPGGLGKTRLANVIARRAAVPAVTVVPLAGLMTAGDVEREVAAALDAGEHRQPGPSLLVLDNCEHVVATVAGLVRELVATTAELRILTTGRTPLGLSSEAVHQLPELSPAAGAELFRQRARAARPGADLPPAAVEELCRHLDGLPLAIELAAARVRTMAVAEVARRLDDRFGLLRGSARDAPPRHHTLHAVVDWSWNLLDPAGQAAMRALSVFADGFTTEAAARLLGADPPPVLEQLAAHSLLKVDETPAGTRLRMLETVREFSAAHREAAGETEAVTSAYLGWARAFGLTHHARLFAADPYDAAAAVQAEQDNLLHALRLALGRDDRPTVAAIVAVVGGLWLLDSDYRRLSTLIGQTSGPLTRYRPEPAFTEVTCGALTLIVAASFGADGPRPLRAFVALRRLGPGRAGTVFGAVGRVIGAADDPAELRRLGDSAEPLLAGAASTLVSYHRETAGEVDEALRAARRALDRFAGRDLPWVTAAARCRLAELCLQLEHGAEARGQLLAALPVFERLGLRASVAGVRTWLVLAGLQTGDADEAERWLDGLPPHALGEVREAEAVGYDLGVRAELLLVRGDVPAALHLWRRVTDQLRESARAGGTDPWVVEARSVAVVAHARHGRLALVADVAGTLPGRLEHLLQHPLADPPPYLVEQAMSGTLLLAVGLADLARAQESGDRAAAVRMVALAERFRFLRTFQPTMSAAAARADAEQADRPAYQEAVLRYAGLDRAGLRAAALELLDQRERSRL